jgi:hypothetical protein
MNCLDYSEQRFYTSQFGRFMSADRFMQTPKANDSGSWNKYSYTRGDPAGVWSATIATSSAAVVLYNGGNNGFQNQLRTCWSLHRGWVRE